MYYSPSLKWFRIQTDDGKVVHITITLKNLPAFASAVLTNVLPSRIDTGTKAVLNATASGDLPSLQGWGDHIDDGPLRKHTGNLIIGILLIVSMSSLAVLSFLSPGKHGSPWITAMCLGMAAPGGCLIVQYFRVRHHVEPTGMNYRTGFSSGSLRWNEVQSVHYSRMLNWFRIQTKEGSVIHISATLKNLPNLASCILTHVSPSCIDHSTTAALNAAASGRRLSLRG